MSKRAPKVDPVSWLVFIASAVSILLAVYFLISSLINTVNSNSTKGELDSTMKVAAASDNLKPIGQSLTADAKPAAPVAARSGKEVYESACATCHATGVAGAPKIDDKAAWEPRVATGIDALMNIAINGKGAMPARGGNPSVTDAELKATIAYMTKQAGFDLAIADEPAAAPVKEATPEKTEAAPDTTPDTAPEEKSTEADPVKQEAPAVATEPKAPEQPASPISPAITAVVAANNEEVTKSVPDVKKIYFELESESLPKDTDLSSIIDYVKNNDKAVVEISGYHDASGDLEKNAELAKHRAQAVAKILQKSGLEENVIQLKKPEEMTGTGTAEDARRVELTVKIATEEASAKKTQEKPPAEAPIAEPAAVAAIATTSPSAETIEKGKAIYNKSCFACHATGVAGSPKLDDKAAWAPRIATGMDTLYNSSMNGKGAMPAKGGNGSLADEDVKAAVDYMVSEAK